jgi:hypothetical protein
MYKLLPKFLAYFIIFFFLATILLMPFNWHYIGSYSEIFPAFDLIMIYYVSTYIQIKNWHLFLVGLLLDQLYKLPFGTNSLTLILGNLLLIQSASWLILKNYYTNIGVFYLYSLFVISGRFIIVTINSDYYIQGIGIYFYYCTTVFSYPIVKTSLNKSFDILKQYGE